MSDSEDQPRINNKISAIIQRLWDLNENKFTRNVHYVLDLQNEVQIDNTQNKRNKKKKQEVEEEDDDGLRNDFFDNLSSQNVTENDDFEPIEEKYLFLKQRPLITFLDIDHMWKIPTFRHFLRLLDNYTPQTGTEEVETYDQVLEQNNFIDACLDTPLMQEAHRFLVEQGKASENEEDFKRELMELWFQFYARSQAEDAPLDSSPFEHVFVGEKRGKKKVLGFHNWIDYYYLEKKGEIQYLGYIPSKTMYDQYEQTEDPGVIAIKFKIDGMVKPLGGFLVGFCPEFEIALYTILFHCSGKSTRIRFANLEMAFDCFKMERDGRRVLATLYPTI